MSEAGPLPEVGSITPEPTPDEVAAIVAAIEATWPKRVATASGHPASPVWRFSGRWWKAPVAARRERPRTDWKPFR